MTTTTGDGPRSTLQRAPRTRVEVEAVVRERVSRLLLGDRPRPLPVETAD